MLTTRTPVIKALSSPYRKRARRRMPIVFAFRSWQILYVAHIFPEGWCYFKSRFVMVSFSIFHNKSSPPTTFPSLPFHLNWWKDWGTSRSWSPFSRTTATVAHFIECVRDTAFKLIDHEMKHGLHKKSRLNYTYEVWKEEFLPAICSWTMRTLWIIYVLS